MRIRLLQFCLASYMLFLAAVSPLHAQEDIVWDGSMSWPFKPPKDEFREDAVFDLRRLNERESGEHGFIRLSEDGNSFVRGDGQPIRFWGLGTNLWLHKLTNHKKGDVSTRHSPEDMARHCRFAAKYGVNMMRVHHEFCDYSPGSDIMQPDMHAVDSLWRFVAAAKKEGIYLTVCPYWGHKEIPASWGLAGYDGSKDGLGAIYFNPRLQEAYRNWTRIMYTTVNPYTGVALKDDPTVAIIQTVNEDSLLFWTVDRLPEPQMELLTERWETWLKERYGSVEEAHAAWRGNKTTRPKIWEILKTGSDRRQRDYCEFLTDLQHDFYSDMRRYFRDELGMQCLVNASNWKTAAEGTLGDAERWTYTASDVIAKNDYTSDTLMRGRDYGYRIDPGYDFRYGTNMANPLQLPTNRRQVMGMPTLITETTWNNNTIYRAEGPFLISAYQSLTGVDCVYWFAAQFVDWDLDPRWSIWQVKPGPRGKPLKKGLVFDATLGGQFPAAALIFRQQYFKEGKPVVVEKRTRAEILERKPPALTEQTGFDVFRDSANSSGLDGGESTVNRLAYVIGPVMSDLNAEESNLDVTPLDDYIDNEAHAVRSNTGELLWDTKRRVCLMDAPKAQGVCGFLAEAGGSFALTDVSIVSENVYGAVTVVCLDDRPLAESEKVLIQVGTRSRLTGWETESTTFKHSKSEEPVEGEKIIWTGEPPWQVLESKVTIGIDNASLTMATRLDAGGYRAENVPVRRENGRLQIQLPPNTLYLVLE